jgi:hypothetical protein
MAGNERKRPTDTQQQPQRPPWHKKRYALSVLEVLGLTHAQLSIYPSPESEILVVDTPSVLEQHIGAARRQSTAVFCETRAKVHGAVSQWIGFEHAVEGACSAGRTR